MTDSMKKIAIGLVQGESIGELVSRVKGTTELPGLMRNVRRESTALVRTSVMEVANGSRKEMYAANADLFKGYEVVATLDVRTSETCRALDGKQFDMDFQPIGHSQKYPMGPPYHWNCRSTIVPILKSFSDLAGKNSGLSKEKLQKLDSLDKTQRASMTYPGKGQPIIADMTYNDWLKRQSEEIQIDVLGPGRHKLWKEHKLDMVDLVHQNGRPLTLKDLEARF